ncbi:hypothetical protein CR513_51563, partial [Mucuna pruriens]
MKDPNIDWKKLSPKSKVIVSYMRELREKLEKVGRGLDSVQKDTQSVNAKFLDDMKMRGVRDPCENWEALKRVMRAREIQDIVKLQHYKNLSELVHQAIKVEMQIRRRGASRNTYGEISG